VPGRGKSLPPRPAARPELTRDVPREAKRRLIR
jgi:hypothetical protein